MKTAFRTGLLLVFVAAAAFFYFLDPAEHVIFPKCPLHSITGLYCPGCGSQRAFHSLLHLDFAGVLHYNFLFLPALLLVFYHYLHPVLNRLFGLKLPNIFYLKMTPWIIFAIIILFWILRNLPYYPFTVLAPD